MRKIVLTISTLLLSGSLLAATSNLGSAILSGIQSHSSANSLSLAFPFEYGGQDISKPIVATADESLWIGQRSLIA